MMPLPCVSEGILDQEPETTDSNSAEAHVPEFYYQQISTVQVINVHLYIRWDMQFPTIL